MSEIIRNAIILAAGSSSRFVPLSAETPKGLLYVKGEILIERQIRQLNEAGINDITVVVGYKAEQFEYLEEKFGVQIVMNEDYARYNNTSSMIRVLDKLSNTYICSSDNYFQNNVFEEDPQQSYYSSLYAEGYTDEYCLTLDDYDNITDVAIGGKDSWYMIGHVYFSEDFSNKFREIMISEYTKDSTKLGYWEDVYIKHIKNLPMMKIHRYGESEIREFDSIDELRSFDESYISDTRSSILKDIATRLECQESDMSRFKKVSSSDEGLIFTFVKGKDNFCFNESDNSITLL